MKPYHGGCHCGLMQMTYRTALDPALWPLRFDGCSFCRKHGVAATSDPGGELIVEFMDNARVQRYRFGTRSADFLICGDCGVFVAAITESPTGTRGAINARVMANVELDFNRVTVASLEGESIERRQSRRERNWTPVKS